MDKEILILAFTLTFAAGILTGVGSLMSFFSKKFNPKFLAASLGFSAGVMIYISLVEIFPEANDIMSSIYGDKVGNFYTILSFFVGVAFVAIIDRLIPDFGNPHEISNIKRFEDPSRNKKKLFRVGMFTAIAIAIHNFPEGLATFMSTLADPNIGISIAVAIAIHNIPEGIAVSVPIYYATKSRKKAFWISLFSGLAEPVGALLGFFILRNFFTDSILGFIFASVAGIMIYISLDELLPTAEEYGHHHIATRSLMFGMFVMAMSLLLFI